MLFGYKLCLFLEGLKPESGLTFLWYNIYNVVCVWLKSRVYLGLLSIDYQIRNTLLPQADVVPSQPTSPRLQCAQGLIVAEKRKE